MDLSKHTSLVGIAEVVEVVQTAASELDCPFYLTGAMARDLWLSFAFGIDTGRRTEDLDFAVQCANWETFERLAARLSELGLDRESDSPHRLRHPNGTEIDLLPFGGVERSDRTIAWPPREDQVLNLSGFSELARETTRMLLPGNVRAPVISQPALALLKLIAWEDRRTQGVRKDAADLYLIGRTYLRTRIPTVSIERESQLLEWNAFDDKLAGADLLGSEMASLGTPELRRTATRILQREADPEGPLRLAHAIKQSLPLRDLEPSTDFLAALHAGYVDSER